MKFSKKIINEFLKYSALNCTEETVRQFSYDLHQFYNRAKEPTIDTITIKKIVDYTQYIKTLPKGVGSRSSNNTQYIAPRTVARKITVIKNFFKFLNKVYDIGIVAEKIDIPKYSKPRMEYLSKPEFDNFLTLIKNKKEDREHKIRSVLLISLAYYTGMRLSELLSVKVEDILKDTKMQILGKGKVWRTVYYTKEIQSLTREYLKFRTAEIPISIFTKKQRKLKGKWDLLFIRHDDVGFGKWLSKSRVCWIFKEYSEDLGKKVHCHMLRHSFATFMLENDVSIRLIQELLWHKYITTTQSYVHISNSYAQREYDRVFKKQASY